MANEHTNPLIFDLVEPILVCALRSTAIAHRSKDTRRLTAVLNVISSKASPSLRKAALMQMWWFDLDFVCEKDLSVEFLELQLGMWPGRPLQYVPDLGVLWAMKHHRADLLDWWAKHQGGPIFISKTVFDKHLSRVSDSDPSNRSPTPLGSPRVLETLKWFCTNRSGIDLDSPNLPDVARSLSPMQSDLAIETFTKMLGIVLRTGHGLTLLAPIGVIVSALRVRLTNDFAWIDACATGDLNVVHCMEQICHPPPDYRLDTMLAAAYASGNTKVIEWCQEQHRERGIPVETDPRQFLGPLSFKGHVDLLEKWFASQPSVSRVGVFAKSLLGRVGVKVGRRPHDCISLVPIAQGGHVHVLKWWLSHSERAGVELADADSVHLAASIANQRAVLDWWYKSSGFTFTANDAVEGSKNAILHGHVDILEFWYRVSEQSFRLEWDLKVRGHTALDIVSDKGYVDVLRWWKSKDLPMEYTAFAMDSASQRGHIAVLEWWLRESGLPQDQLKYGRQAMYFTDELPENEFVDDVIDCWQDSGLDLMPICDEPDCRRSFVWRLLKGYGRMPERPVCVTKPLFLDMQRQAGVPIDYGSLARNTLSAGVLDWCRSRARAGEFPFTANNMPEKWADVLKWWNKCGLVGPTK